MDVQPKEKGNYTDGPLPKTFCNIGDESKGAAMKTFKSVLSETVEERQDLRLLVVGRTGEGKSTFINSIIEMGKPIAAEGAGANNCTHSVQQYFYSDVIPGVNVTVIDSPGLQDIHQIEQSYIQKMKSECEAISLVLYCMKMTDHRLTNDDLLAMRKLHQAFGPKFWERVVFVLTFANKEDCGVTDERDEAITEPPLDDVAAWEEVIRKRFTGRIKYRASEVTKFLREKIFSNLKAEVIVFEPAGNYKLTYNCRTPFRLPDRENWLYELLKSSCHQIKTTHRFKKLSLNDKIHLAVIVDNNAKATDNVQMNNKAKNALENLGYCVLYFNGLNSESISHLLEALQCVDHSDLATFALIILSEGKTHHVYDVNNDRILFENFFARFTDVGLEKKLAEVPKLFFFHLAHQEKPKYALAFNVKLPRNSIALAVSVKCLNENAPSPAIDAFVKNLSSSKPLKQCFTEIQDGIQDVCASSQLIDELSDSYVLPTPYKPSTAGKERAFLKKQLHLYHAIWRPVRCKTVDVLFDTKDEVLGVLRVERITKIAASSTSAAVGGGLVIAGIALAPFTLGASLGLSLIGGTVGVVTGAGGIAAVITSNVMSNSRLKKAQQHVSFDQQLSRSVNSIATKYSESLNVCRARGNGKSDAIAGVQASSSDSDQLGIVASVGADSVVEGGALAARTTGRFLGAILTGATLAVTVPIDVGVIAYNGYLLHKSSGDKSGKSDSNVVVQWFVKQIEETLKGTFTTIDAKEHKIKKGQTATCTFNNPDSGYRLIVPDAVEDDTTIGVRTVFSGPFVLPEGATLVSAVYDVLLGEKLQVPVTIEIEHCVDIIDQSTAEKIKKMTFATATADFDRKVFEFTPLDIGTFPQGQTYGSFSLEGSSLLCVLYYGGSQQDHLMNYAAQCSFTKECKNFWKMDVTFTKYLSAHYKFIQMDATDPVTTYPFKFTRPSTSDDLPCVKLEDLKHNIRESGWMISHHVLPCDIYKSVLDTDELQDFQAPHSITMPSLQLAIQVEDEKKACDELNTVIKANGTTLELHITQKKDQEIN